jgi:hypothetical protein
MNTKIKLIGITLFVAVALVTLGTGLAFAQQDTPTPWPGGRMGGSGMMGGNAAWMQTMHEWMTTSGGMHTLVWDSLAKTLGLTTDELYAELNSGKTLAQLGEEKGISRADLAADLEATVKTGLDKAVADGALTQEQADWMLSNMSGRFDWMLDNMGQGGMMGGFGGRFGSGGCHGNWTGANPAPSSKP